MAKKEPLYPHVPKSRLPKPSQPIQRGYQSEAEAADEDTETKDVEKINRKLDRIYGPLHTEEAEPTYKGYTLVGLQMMARDSHLSPLGNEEILYKRLEDNNKLNPDYKAKKWIVIYDVPSNEIYQRIQSRWRSDSGIGKPNDYHGYGSADTATMHRFDMPSKESTDKVIRIIKNEGGIVKQAEATFSIFATNILSQYDKWKELEERNEE